MAVEQKGADFGARLREARERRGVTLRTIADATKISVRALEALERNDISQLPGGIFSRSFVRAYAQEVGLDPEQTIADFITQFPVETVTQGHPRTRSLVDELHDEPRRGLATALRVAAILLPVALAGAYLVFSGRSTPSAVTPPVAQAATPAVAASSALPEQVAQALAIALDVTLRVRGTCVVTVSADDGAPTVLALHAGDSHRMTASREIALSVSDPTVVAWTINGAAARPLTGPVRVTPASVASFLAAQ